MLRFIVVASAMLVGLLPAKPARGEPSADGCVREKSPGDSFVVCFDPGNRLFVSASATGLGAAWLVRHKLLFSDEPDLTWKLEHELLATEVGYDERGVATAYSGRYIRHARDGHIVLPFGLPRKVFVPFDVGVDFATGIFRGPIREAMPFSVGVVRAAALVDAYRGDGFRRRVAFGIGSRWDLAVDRTPLQISEHLVVPLSSAVVDVHFESANGLTQLDLRAEAGGEWSSVQGWRRSARGELSGERVVLAINDRPLSLFARATYDDGFTADIGLRVAAF